MKVKICGITNIEDALTAAEAGADYLGFVLYPPSKRGVDTDQVRQIAAELRSLDNCPVLVGVFVNETADFMAQTLDQCGLEIAQLSGDEPPSLVGDEKSPIYGRCYKALRPTSLAVAEAEAEWYLPPTLSNPPAHPSLLIDSYHPSLHGGTGETGDWSISATLAQSIPGLMLAGGLTAANVETAVRQVQPFAVDVASGVEARPGVKDHALVHAFITNAKR